MDPQAFQPAGALERAGYRGPDGREHSKSFLRRSDAERWLRDELHKQDRGLWVDPSAGAVPFEE